MSLENYYTILGVGTHSSAAEIKRAHRSLAKMYHPDKNIGDKNAEEKFKKIQEAYNVLSDEEKKREYDRRLQYNKYEQHFSPDNSRTKKNQRGRSSNHDKIVIVATLTVIGSLLPIAYFFSGVNDENSTVRIKEFSVREKRGDSKQKNETAPVKKIRNADSPYDAFFGEGPFDLDAKSYILIHNTDLCEAVICLVENKPPYKTIRNEYLREGVTYKITAIPNGDYFLKVYFGKNWSLHKKLLSGRITGGFEKEGRLCKYDFPNDIFEIKQFLKGDNSVFTSYERTLDLDSSKSKLITEEEFFR